MHIPLHSSFSAACLHKLEMRKEEIKKYLVFILTQFSCLSIRICMNNLCDTSEEILSGYEKFLEKLKIPKICEEFL